MTEPVSLVAYKYLGWPDASCGIAAVMTDKCNRIYCPLPTLHTHALFHSIQHSGGAQALPPSNKNYAVKIIRRLFLYDYSTGVQWPAPKKDNILGDQCQAPAR